MSLAGPAAAIPRPLPRTRPDPPTRPGIRIVGMVWEDLKPSRHPDAKRHSKNWHRSSIRRSAARPNAPIHINAAGPAISAWELDIDDWAAIRPRDSAIW